MNKIASIACGFVLALLVWSGPSLAAGPATAQVRVSLTQYVNNRTKAILDDYEETGDLKAALAAARAVFAQAVFYAPDDRDDALRRTDFTLRLVADLVSVPREKRLDLVKFLRANPTLAESIVFLHNPHANSRGVFEALDHLRPKRAAQLEKYATLAAAVCLVHAEPLVRQINENTTTSADPLDIFDYYVANENKMFFGIRNVPTELLVWVVDTTASIDEMNWALARYAGDKNVGHRFFDIKYDTDNFRKGTPKKVTQMGYTLRNILLYGGVCADQAYFASAVGKAIGVPTAYAVGESGEAGHAWVGFLQSNGSQGWWNFNEGRYEAFQGVRGLVEEPQSRKDIPDSFVSLGAEMIGTKAIDRQNAVAITDAALHLIGVEAKELADVPPPDDQVIPGTLRPRPRKADSATEQALFEAALRQSVGYSRAWLGVRDLAVAGKLSLADKRRWSELLIQLGAKKYPDFTLDVLMPMIATIDNAQQQDELWQNAFNIFQNRLDLAASIRMKEAKLWESQKNTEKAGICYMDVITRYANSGGFVVNALRGAEKLLIASNHSDRVATLYEQCWNTIPTPKEMAGVYTTQTNWYRIGKMYADKLKEAGNTGAAQAIEAELAAKAGGS